MILGLGVDYGPSLDQLGAPAVDPALTGRYPFGSIGDQWETCVAAGGDPASCSTAVIQTNATVGGGAAPGTRPASKTLLLVALVFFGVVVLRAR